MVTQITLGNAFQQNGRTIIGGSQSGFDIESLVESLATAKALPAKDLETANETIDKQQEAFASLKTILSSFQTAVDSLRNPPGVNNASQNAFAYRKATSTTNTGALASSYASVSVVPGANLQTITIDSITTLASQAGQSSNTLTLADTTTASAVAATSTAGFFAAGSVTLKGLNGASNQTITLNAGDSLQAVVNKFNAVKSSTGIQANILTVADGSYKVIFAGTKTGAANDFNLNSASTVISDTSGALASLGFGAATPAVDASFSVAGIPITRSSNSVADVIPGVTINLLQPTAGVSITTVVSADTSIVSSAIQSMADAYNSFRLFESTQNQRNSDGSPAETAYLAQDTTLRTIQSQISAEVTRTIAALAGTSGPARLADIGITFSDFAGDATNPATSNIMNIDTDALTSAISSDFEGVRSLFEYTLTSDNSALSTFKRSNALAISSFTLNIDRTTETYTADYIDEEGNAQSVTLDGTAISATGGLTLKGQSGTVLEGLELIFASTATNPSPISVTITQGFGDRLYNAIESYINTTDGFLTNAVTALTEKVSSNEEAIAKINDQVVLYRDQITKQYSALEAALSKANNLLALLDAQEQARNSN